MVESLDYEGMTRRQLEVEAASRTPAVDFSKASNNVARVRLLREDDERRAAEVEDAVTEGPVTTAAERAPFMSLAPSEIAEVPNQGSPDYTTFSQDALEDTIATPYPSAQDLQNRIDNAASP